MNDPYEQKNLRRGLPKQAYNVERPRRCSILENKLKPIEGVDNFGSMDPKELNLVPNLVILPKFKMPNFEIFDGTKCPKTHLAMYCKKWRSGYAFNEELLIHVFQESLTGSKTN